jgi:5'-3' exonuclease
MSLEKYANLLRELNQEKEQDSKLSDLNDRILVIDGLNLFIRCWSAIPTLNEDGAHIGGLAGFMKSLGALVRQYKPTRCIIVFDGKNGSARRKKLFPDYKAGRTISMNVNRAEHMKQQDDTEKESMRLQFARLSMYLQQLPLSILSVDGVEADDVIGYIATELYKESEIIISSMDKDFLHLITDKVKVWSPVKKKLYDKERVLNEYKIPIQNFLLWRTIDGDNSDKIGGIKGVGIKSLIAKVPIILEDKALSVEDLINYAKQQITDGSNLVVYKKIVEGEDILNRNAMLMDLRKNNFPGQTKLKIQRLVENAIPALNRNEFKQMFMVDRMFSVLNNIDNWLTSSFNTLDAFGKK